jgi:hypothetical protein
MAPLFHLQPYIPYDLCHEFAVKQKRKSHKSSREVSISSPRISIPAGLGDARRESVQLPVVFLSNDDGRCRAVWPVSTKSEFRMTSAP